MNRKAWYKALIAALQTSLIGYTAFAVGIAMYWRSRNSRAGQLFPSRATLARDVGCAESTVERATAELRNAGLLIWEQRRKRWNRYATNLYTLTVPKVDRNEVVDKSLRRKAKILLDSCSPPMRDGSDSPLDQAALAQLSVITGRSSRDLMPWLCT